MSRRSPSRSSFPGAVRVSSALIAVFAVALVACACSCGKSGDDTGARSVGPMRVVVTLAPLKGLVQPLLPADAEVKTLIAPGRSEHGFEPTVEDVLALERADVVVLVGLGLETSVDRVLRRRPRPSRHEARLGEILGLEDPHAGHGHDAHAGHSEHDAHDHAIDPHIWLDPILVRQAMPRIASLIKASMGASGLGDPAAVDAGLADVVGRIDALDAEYRAALAPFAGRAIVTHHAAFGRLAERYGLRVVEVIRPIEGAEPTPANIAATMDAIKREGVRAIFVEPQFDTRGAQLIAERAGVALGRLDPLGTGDWFAMMESNLQELLSNLGP